MSVTMAERIHASWCRTAKVEPELGIGPQRSRLNLVQILDQVQRAQPAAGLERPAQLRRQNLVVVLTLDLARRPKPDRARRHICQSLDHSENALPGLGDRASPTAGEPGKPVPRAAPGVAVVTERLVRLLSASYS
jgi:hypothetical protein